MSAKSFHCSVITPEKAALECDADSVVFPAFDGEVGILKNRAPLICRLGIGVLRIQSGGERQTMFIDGGFAQVSANQLTVITEQAKKPEELDKDAIEQAMVEARAMPITDDLSADRQTKATRRASVQLRMLS
ncbi:MAG: ATP synthase F1 subunit epsilon [Planctomycetota bacterium]|jgi:F-type H+-transporting ATPase subunit epsilon